MTDLFGWTHTETNDVADPVGGYRMFAWDGSGNSVGGLYQSRTRGEDP